MNLPRHCEHRHGSGHFCSGEVVQKCQAHGLQVSQECPHEGHVHEAEKSHHQSRKHEEMNCVDSLMSNEGEGCQNFRHARRILVDHLQQDGVLINVAQDENGGTQNDDQRNDEA
ncbi:hypothetical protein TNIN_405201 [Trichonephila inaurata madagascariensis]|uniref:Uncharacterized protein n=1 Tax=Trichonephila inaurata madagascariensis TaxID=2747483 RepID=A0A8X7C6Y6_9ARAC|nr:hypothetical protein TNIN_405201 [Trichonephila inaurata madagascariensis]